VPVVFVDEGPLDGAVVQKALERAGYGRVAAFPSLVEAARAHDVEPSRALHLVGEGRRLEASGLAEADSLRRGLELLHALRLDAGDDRDEAQRAHQADLAQAQRDFPWLALRSGPERPSEKLVALV
jgi:hypothetical protein